MDIMDKRVKGRNSILLSVWIVLICFFGVLISFQVFAGSISQHYETGFYMLSVGLTWAATITLICLWWHFATSTANFRMWIATHTGTASAVFVILAFVCAVAFIAFCPYIYTPDKRNSLFMSAGLIFPMLFTGLMYLLPPVEIEQTILPIPGRAQIAVRVLQFLIWLTASVALFVYNFI